MKERKTAEIDREEPADENISAEPPSHFDRREGDYEPGIAPPGQRRHEEKDESDREKGTP